MMSPLKQRAAERLLFFLKDAFSSSSELKKETEMSLETREKINLTSLLALKILPLGPCFKDAKANNFKTNRL